MPLPDKRICVRISAFSNGGETYVFSSSVRGINGKQTSASPVGTQAPPRPPVGRVCLVHLATLVSRGSLPALCRTGAAIWKTKVCRRFLVIAEEICQLHPVLMTYSRALESDIDGQIQLLYSYTCLSGYDGFSLRPNLEHLAIEKKD